MFNNNHSMWNWNKNLVLYSCISLLKRLNKLQREFFFIISQLYEAVRSSSANDYFFSVWMF